jgi:hypothetical protein
MRKTMMVWSACAAAALPACAAGTAMADGVPVQGAGQLATSTQSAQSSATSTQTNPTNNAVSVAILSPGAATGAVNQANNSSATSAAGNLNATAQNAAQGAGGGGGGGEQGVGQAASSAQSAASSATSTQTNPTNNAINVAILSPHASSGAVKQANNSSADSTAANKNKTDQNAEQSGGGRGGSGGVQAAGQAADNRQSAESSATSTQTKPTNNAVSLSILSPKSSSGPVDQANNSSADSTAYNANKTDQNAGQSSGGPTMIEKSAPRKVDGCESCGEPSYDRCESCHPDLPGVQGIGQLASNEQSARSSATSTQTNPTNNAVSLSILSPGSYTGPVSQANNSSATSFAGNKNKTDQNARQLLGSGGGVQGIGQAAYNAQSAASSAVSDQYCPTNFALSGGGSGPVHQANNSSADSAAGNKNSTYQNALQALGGYWPPVVKI